MPVTIKRIGIRGFKSIRDLPPLELGSLTVLIGANGAGKSNFLDAFRFLRRIAPARELDFLDASIIHVGSDTATSVEFRLETVDGLFELIFVPAPSGALTLMKGSEIVLDRFARMSSRWVAYHFGHLGSIDSDGNRGGGYLSPDASDLSRVLRRIRSESTDNFDLILDTVRLIAPFVADLVPDAPDGEHKWISTDGARFSTRQLSDGTLRFLCIAVALMQPPLPELLILDEPELGLHPVAVSILSDMIHTAAERTQVIISTQSPALLDHMRAEDVVLVNRADGQSTFERLDETMVGPWLSDHSLGELWQKNVLETGPHYE
jgi:predicted ATPase